ncbi:histidine phosphatase family protein [Luedemannella helvata]|uniref:Histidine phosphatase family protein n=1 Tax=Luedemannella helvata TaxID=349315 RepID=A0ABN2K9V0_9ACTN
MGTVYLIRHGETEWSRSGQHTSFTDLDLTARGADQAAALAPVLAGVEFAAVLTSPRLRARRTADLAGLPGAVVDEDLAEWHYGGYEGLTTAQIHERAPGWSLWTDGGGPGGETPEQVGERVDRLLARVRSLTGDVALVAHGHCLRVIAARWVGLPVALAKIFYLDTATVSVLGHEHGEPVLRRWNAAA